MPGEYSVKSSLMLDGNCLVLVGRYSAQNSLVLRGNYLASGKSVPSDFAPDRTRRRRRLRRILSGRRRIPTKSNRRTTGT